MAENLHQYYLYRGTWNRANGHKTLNFPVIYAEEPIRGSLTDSGPAVGRLRQYPWLFKTCYGIDRQIVHSVPYILLQYKRPHV